MHQYFVKDHDQVQVGDFLTLSQEDSHHYLHVLRAKPGQEVVLVVGQERWRASLNRVEDDLAVMELVESLADQVVSTELPFSVTIACGLSKNDKIDAIVQKATECGMASFQPLALHRDVVKWEANKAEAKRDRLQKIAQAAAQQSKRQVIPSVESLWSFKELLEHLADFDHVIVAYEEMAKQGEKGILVQTIQSIEPGQSLLAIFGSEGGLTQSEVDQLVDRGAKACGLGPRILRAETAPIYLLSAVSFYSELFNQ